MSDLISAAKAGDIASVQKLIQSGVDVNRKDADGWTPMHRAAENGHIELVNKLLANGADVHAKTSFGETPLHKAAENGHIEVVNALFTKGADVHAKNKFGETPLHRAATSGVVIEVVNVLFTKGADVNAKGGLHKETPLHRAAKNGHLEVVNCLLANGADVHAKAMSSDTPLHYAAKKGHVEVVNCLLTNGANVHAILSLGETPLHRAAENGHIEVVNTLLANGADVNAKAMGGHKPLHGAAMNGYLEMVNTLLANGADLHVKDAWGHTPLYWAAKNGHAEVANCLLAKGADMHVMDKNGKTAVDIAITKGYLNIVQCLENAFKPVHEIIDALNAVVLEFVLTNNSSDIEKIENGNTPLLHAAERGFYEGVETLLRHKANIYATEEHTLYTVLHLTVLKGDIPMLQLVLECGQESLINNQDKDGNTAMHLAIGLGREDCVQTLLFFYPDMKVRNHQGESVLECAVKLHAWNIFVLLCQHVEGSQLLNEVNSQSAEESWLVVAYRDRHVGAMEWLLEHGGGGDWHDIDTQSGLSIVHMVCQELCNHHNLIAACISPAAFVSSSSKESLDPVLHLQVFFQRFQQAPWLLLHYGAEHGKKEVLETVLETCSSADASLINRQDETKDDNTAMHLAGKGGHLGCVRSLLYFYSDLTVVNKDGETSLYTAAKHHQWEIFHVLFQHGNGGSSSELHDAHHPNTGTAEGKDSLLKLAVQDKQTEVVCMLVEKAGADAKQLDGKSGLRILLKLLEEVIPAKDEEVVVQICDWLCSLVEANQMLSGEFIQLGGRRVLGCVLLAYDDSDCIFGNVAKIITALVSSTK